MRKLARKFNIRELFIYIKYSIPLETAYFVERENLHFLDRAIF